MNTISDEVLYSTLRVIRFSTRTPLKHTNQFVLFLAKVLCPTILANIAYLNRWF